MIIPRIPISSTTNVATKSVGNLVWSGVAIALKFSNTINVSSNGLAYKLELRKKTLIFSIIIYMYVLGMVILLKMIYVGINHLS